jgi:acetate kinase
MATEERSRGERRRHRTFKIEETGSENLNRFIDDEHSCTLLFIFIHLVPCKRVSLKVLIPNIGSTSFKYRLIEVPGDRVLAEGRIERIGQPGGECPDYPTALRKCIATLCGEGKPLARLQEIEAVGFKAVHAGSFARPQIIDASFLDAMSRFNFLAPAHNPPYLVAIDAFRAELPGVPLVAVPEPNTWRFLDEAATTYAVPYAWRTEHGIRRYGFHGASHRAASEFTLAALGASKLRHISCHLGGSSSVGAFRDGVGIDVSMGASPQSGLPQNNRVGDVDVFAVLYMMKQLGLGPDEMASLLGSKAGLAGVSGTSGDVRDLEQAAAAGDARSRLALDLFVRSVRHYLGAFLLELGGVDVITFSGGIGENSAAIRSAILSGLGELGIVLDRPGSPGAGH